MGWPWKRLYSNPLFNRVRRCGIHQQRMKSQQKKGFLSCVSATTPGANSEVMLMVDMCPKKTFLCFWCEDPLRGNADRTIDTAAVAISPPWPLCGVFPIGKLLPCILDKVCKKRLHVSRVGNDRLCKAVMNLEYQGSICWGPSTLPLPLVNPKLPPWHMFLSKLMMCAPSFASYLIPITDTFGPSSG